MNDWIFDHLGWVLVVLILLMVALFVNIANKQEKEKKVFMVECLQDHKQYECDVLWSQTDASKQVRDAAIGAAAGAAIGAAAGRR